MAANPYRPQPIRAALIRTLAKAPPPDSPKEIRDKQQGMILRHQPSGYLGLYVELGRGKRERLCDARRIIDPADELTLGAVRQRAQELRGRSAMGEDFTAQRAERRAVPTLETFLRDTYGPWVKGNRVSGEQTLDRIKAHFEQPFGRYKLDAITIAKVDQWATKRRKDGVLPETINRDLSALHAALSRAVKLKLVAEHPLKGMEPLKVDSHRRVVRALTEDEETRLRAALEARDATKRQQRANANEWRRARGYDEYPPGGKFADPLTPAVLLSLETGMRRGELFALEWPDVSLSLPDSVIRLRGTTTKSYTSREVPLNASARRVLRDWWLQQGQPREGYVLTADGGMLGSLKKSYKRALDDAGIESPPTSRINWHSLRHTFGSRLGRAGVDGSTLRELMGHASITTTQRYLHSDADRKRAAVERLAQ